jgi:hypothetical protein
MYLTVNLNDPADIRAAIEELQRRLAPVGDVAVADVFVEDICRRLGMRMQALVGAVLDAEEDRWLTIRDLATILDRPWSSVKGSLNGPLATAIQSAKANTPGAPAHLFEWHKRADGHWEFRILPWLRPILRRVLTTIPQAA